MPQGDRKKGAMKNIFDRKRWVEKCNYYTRIKAKKNESIDTVRTFAAFEFHTISAGLLFNFFISVKYSWISLISRKQVMISSPRMIGALTNIVWIKYTYNMRQTRFLMIDIETNDSNNWKNHIIPTHLWIH